MRGIKPLCLIAALAAALGSGTAWADRGHGHHHVHGDIGLGLYFGAPYPYPYYYAPYPYYPYYPYPPVIAAPASPPVYVERGDQDEGEGGEYYWYRCDKPEGYYPYVQECPGGWKQVEPRPPR